MMRRCAIVGGLVLLLTGCGGDPPPVYEAKKVETPKNGEGEFKLLPRPEASDPEGKKLLDEMLAAHSAGDVAKLAPFRECSFTRKGKIETLEATWTRHLVWPDRYRLQTEINLGGGVKRQLTHALSPGGAWQWKDGDGPTTTPMETADKRDLTSQFQEDALTLLFVLADPQTVVTRAPDRKIRDDELLGLHVWTPAVEFARLEVNKNTKLLTRFTYTGREANTPVVKEVVFQEHKEFAGVKLGSKMYLRAGGRVIAEWAELTLDPTKPDAKVFTEP